MTWSPVTNGLSWNDIDSLGYVQCSLLDVSLKDEFLLRHTDNN
jgi:hypothetical protein